MPPPLNTRGHLPKALLLMLLSVLLVSCETVSYYTQAARGQMAIVFGREDIARLLAGEELDADLRQKFTEVLAIRQYAEQELGLPVGRQYSSYVDIDREHVVWNVFAAPEFSTDPLNWCYPVAGCVSYRGYFSEAGAQRYALRLEEDGFDVYTGGVDAYSTLGWFEDPLLSTVLSRSGHQLAALIFHELAHQVVYLPGDTTFNESFATAVEREGLRRWLLDSDQAELISTAQADMQRQQEFIDLVSSYREQFTALYERELDPGQMRDGKARLQQELREAYALQKAGWGGYAGYDSWFDRSLNNAQLSTVTSYNDLVPSFRELLANENGDLQAFYREARAIAELAPQARKQRLEALQQAAAGTP